VDGSLSKPSQIVVLVEDQRHQRFVRKYLARRGFEGSAIRQIALPAGKGSGEQYVREKYAYEVDAFRKRNMRATTWMVIAIDADALEVTTRARQLEEKLAERGLPGRADDEAIIHLIPKRNIETWILYLTGAAVNEETDYRHDARIDAGLPAASIELFARSRPNAAPEAGCIPSLCAAISETRRLG
jgi:hypothetical protein